MPLITLTGDWQQDYLCLTLYKLDTEELQRQARHLRRQFCRQPAAHRQLLQQYSQLLLIIDRRLKRAVRWSNVLAAHY